MISLTDPGSHNVCWLAAVTRVEVVAALYRRHRLRPVRVGALRRGGKTASAGHATGSTDYELAKGNLEHLTKLRSRVK
jgi:hypothetical protein